MPLPCLHIAAVFLSDLELPLPCLHSVAELTLPPSFFFFLAIRFQKLDDMVTDPKLNGVVEKPETDRKRAVLTCSRDVARHRDVSRKLAFIGE